MYKNAKQGTAEIDPVQCKEEQVLIGCLKGTGWLKSIIHVG